MAGKTVVCICGGGNAAHILAAELGSRQAEFEVRLFAPFADEAERFRAGHDAAGGTTLNFRGQEIKGQVSAVSKDAKDVVPGCSLLIMPLPAFAHRGMMEAMAPHIADGATILAMPGPACFDLVARQALGGAEAVAKRGIIIAGTNQLPYQTRISDYGKSVELIGHKQRIGVAAHPFAQTATVAERLTKVIRVCALDPLPHFLTVTLTPANQCIHPSIMWGLFNSWALGKTYAEAPLFYQNTDDDTAAMMDGVSADFVAVAAGVQEKTGCPNLEVPRVDDMMRHFYREEIVDASCTKTIFCSNKGYAGLTAPMEPAPGGEGLVPKFGYRYLTEDIPFGLCVVKGVGELAGVATPHVDRLILWAQALLGKHYVTAGAGGAVVLDGPDVKETQAPQAFGISLEELVKS